jgi:hypothetical protein
MTLEQRSFMRLFARSAATEGGWRTVSKMLAPVTLRVVAETPDLYEVDQTDGLRIRLTEAGEVVARHL